MPPTASAAVLPFTRYQKTIVALLAVLQFTVILDFMILSPLGAILMPALGASPQQFGWVVSAYAFSAGIAGVLAGGFADRFDRKKFLLLVYAGFLVGTLLCGVAPTYRFLLLARIVTGFFGGVVGSIGFAIVTDLFEPSKRGRVMGALQTAFAASQILGIPSSLLLSNHLGWRAPFLVIVAFGLAIGVGVMVLLKPVDAHLQSTARVQSNPFEHLWRTFSNPRYLQAFATTALLSTGGFMIMPFGSAFSVRNLGLSIEQLPWIYMVTGCCAIIAGPLVGRITDRVGSIRVFTFGSLLTMIMVIVYTRLGTTPIGLVMLVSAVMFVGISARIISSQALISTIPDAVSRGAFMSVSSSIQQASGGVAAALAGWIVVAPTTGPLQNFDKIGYVVVAATLTTMGMMYWLSRPAGAAQRMAAQP